LPDRQPNPLRIAISSTEIESPAPATSPTLLPPPATLPCILVATDGRDIATLPFFLAAATLLRDLDIAALATAADSARPPLGLDIDSIDGLNADAAGVRFVMEELGIRVVLTRRPAIAARVAEAGGTALLHVFAFDSTGLGRSLDAHPRIPGAGTVISPGPVLAHLLPDDIARLPRPIVAYGLIGAAKLAVALLARADAVLLRPADAEATLRLLDSSAAW
jgi:glycerol-3-phosphate responsive antiterminator